MLKVNVLTIFPELFPGFLGSSLTGKALEEHKFELNAINIRDYALDKHNFTDKFTAVAGESNEKYALKVTSVIREEE